MNNYKVTVREVREWTFLISAKNEDEAAHKAKGIAMTEPAAHDSFFEWPKVSELEEEPEAYEVKHIPVTK